MTSRPPFALARATRDDIAELVQLQYQCFDPFIREVIMGCSSEADMPRTCQHYLEIMKDPHDVWIKVTDAETGKIVAGTNWKVYPSSAPSSSDDKPPAWLEGEQRQKSEQTLGRMNEKRKLANPEGYVHLHICFTDPEYRRRGAGHMMLKWGCDLADLLYLPGWVEASDEGTLLYKTFGFYEFECLTGELTVVNMKRDARTKDIEGGKLMPLGKE